MAAIDGGEALVDLEAGGSAVVPAAGLCLGDRVQILARPEDVAVGPADVFGLGFTGTVARVYFVGTDYRLVVEVPELGPLLATIRPATGGAPPTDQGATLALSIPRAALHVVPDAPT